MITGFDKGDKKLGTVPKTPKGRQWVYQIGVPFQLSEKKAAMFCNIRWGKEKAVDLEEGNDLVVFGNTSEMLVNAPLNRSKTVKHRITGHEQLLSVFPFVGGFVPCGALLKNGSPHPFAGTGFAMSRMIGYPTDRKTRTVDVTGDIVELVEIQQYSYDGKNFGITDKKLFEPDKIIPGYKIISSILRAALPEGEDLLCGLTWIKDGEQPSCGIARWKFEGGFWKIAELIPIKGAQECYEPSIVRIKDGSLLFTARAPEGTKGSYINVWRSTDGAKNWDLVISKKGVRSATPVTVNVTADGYPFIMGNPYTECDSKGVPKKSKQIREALYLWPVSMEKRELQPEIKIFDSSTEMPASPSGSIWRLDHPVGNVVRLEDGKWHSIYVYRVLEENECISDAPVTPYTGCYMGEIFSDGEPVATWKFK